MSLGLLALGAADATAAEPPPPADTMGDDGAPSQVEVRGQRAEGYAAHGQVTGTRAARPVNDVPQGITIVPKSLLEDTGARRIEDALAITPSVQLGAGFGSLWEDYLVRGSRVWSGTMYRNGYLGGYSNLAANDAVNVERVEVLRGPAAALYGPGLPGGSINVVTKRPERRAHFDAGVGGGSFGTFRGALDANSPLSSSVALRVTSSYDSTEGFRDHNHTDRFVVNPVAAIDLSKQTHLLLETQLFRVRYRPDPMGVPVLGGDPFALPVNRTLIPSSTPLTQFDGTLFRAELEHRVASDLAIRVGVQRQAARSDESALFGLGLEPDGRTMDRIATHMLLVPQDVAFQGGVEWRPFTGPIEHDVLVGTDVRYEHVAWRLGTSDPGADLYPIDVYSPDYGAPIPPVLEQTGPDNEWSYRDAGIYLNDVMHLLPELRVVLGGRLDGYEQKSLAPSVPNPDGTLGVNQREGELAPSGRAGILYDIGLVPGLTTYASVAQGFWPVLGVTAGAQLLKPERNLGYEAGTRYAMKHDVVTVDLGAFEFRNRNISVADPANPQFQVQRGRAVSRGLETFVTARPFPTLRLMASYTLAGAHVTEDTDRTLEGSQLPFVSTHSGGGWATLLVPLPAGQVELGGGLRAVGKRHLNDHSTIPGYARVDGSLGYRFSVAALHLHMQNLANTRYVQSGNDVTSILFGAPRTVLLMLTASL